MDKRKPYWSEEINLIKTDLKEKRISLSLNDQKSWFQLEPHTVAITFDHFNVQYPWYSICGLIDSTFLACAKEKSDLC